MYIHLGRSTLVKQSHIIGVFDLENTTISKHTRDFLKRSEEKGIVINVCTDIPKSFVVVKDAVEEKVYITQISAATIRKRNKLGYESGGHYVK